MFVRRKKTTTSDCQDVRTSEQSPPYKLPGDREDPLNWDVEGDMQPRKTSQQLNLTEADSNVFARRFERTGSNTAREVSVRLFTAA